MEQVGGGRCGCESVCWGHTDVVSMAYIAPLVDLEISGSYGDKKVGRGHEQ